MFRKVINWIIEKRHLLFLLMCLFILITFLYLHGSVYRYVRNVNGIWEYPKDKRTHGVFYIYKIICFITIGVSVITITPYSISFIKEKNKDNLAFIGFISIFVMLIAISLLVLGVKYV